MKIVYKFGPRAGEIAHVPRSQEIEVLLGAGIIEEVPLSETERSEIAQKAGHTIPLHVLTPEWSVIKHNVTGAVVVQRRYLTETYLFDGVPDRKQWPDLSDERARELGQQFKQMKEHDVALAKANRQERQRV